MLKTFLIVVAAIYGVSFIAVIGMMLKAMSSGRERQEVGPADENSEPLRSPDDGAGAA